MTAEKLIDRVRIAALPLATAALIAVSGTVAAHHGDAGRFEEYTVTMTGTSSRCS
jgi:hypothetical protein